MRSEQLSTQASFLRAVLDALPSMVFVVDENVVVLDANEAAHRALGGKPEIVLKRLCGEVLHCLHSGCGAEPGDASQCGTTEHCETCVLRQSAKAAQEGRRVERVPYTMVLEQDGVERKAYLQVTAAAFGWGGGKLTLLILEDVSALQELLQIVAVCAWCGKVRSDGRFDEDLQTWVSKHTDIRFSHGMCPACAAKQEG